MSCRAYCLLAVRISCFTSTCPLTSLSETLNCSGNCYTLWSGPQLVADVMSKHVTVMECIRDAETNLMWSPTLSSPSPPWPSPIMITLLCCQMPMYCTSVSDVKAALFVSSSHGDDMIVTPFAQVCIVLMFSVHINGRLLCDPVLIDYVSPSGSCQLENCTKQLWCIN